MNHPSRASVGVERPLPELLITREERDRLVALPDCDVRTCPPLYHSVETENGTLVTVSHSYCYAEKDTGRTVFHGCCRNCEVNRRGFLARGGYDFFTDEDRSALQSAWSETKGFIGDAGCKLPRRLRPNECLAMDCKQYIYFVMCEWIDGRWEVDLKRGLKRK